MKRYKISLCSKTIIFWCVISVRIFTIYSLSSHKLVINLIVFIHQWIKDINQKHSNRSSWSYIDLGWQMSLHSQKFSWPLLHFPKISSFGFEMLWKKPLLNKIVIQPLVNFLFISSSLHLGSQILVFGFEGFVSYSYQKSYASGLVRVRFFSVLLHFNPFLSFW